MNIETILMETNLSFEQIEKTNTMIAEFMELTPTALGDYVITINDVKNTVEPFDLLYQRSYERLMPVWNKFALLKFITPSQKRIYSIMKRTIVNTIIHPKGDYPIIHTYLALRAAISVINEFN